MDTVEAIRKRYSCRSFGERVPSEADLQTIAEAGLASPSGMDRQGWRIVVVRDRQLIEDMDEAGLAFMHAMDDQSLYERIKARPTGKLFYNAPCMIVVPILPATPSGAELFDCGIVSQDIALAATSLGINSLICGFATMPFAGPRGPEFKQRLGFPEGFELGIAVLLGYSAEETPKAPHPLDTAKLSWVG